MKATDVSLRVGSNIMPPTLAPPGDGLTRNNLDIKLIGALDTDEEFNQTLSMTYHNTVKNSNEFLL